MDGLLHFITHFGWIGVLAVIFAESGLMVGFFLPGDSLLFVAGTLVQNGIFDINIFLFIVCLVIAAALGNNTGYLIGRHRGNELPYVRVIQPDWCNHLGFIYGASWLFRRSYH
jgi:membrane-associated protein